MDSSHRVGPYQILGSIGAGGMGEVYRARDPRTGRDVALKIVRRPENPVTRKRFAREGALTAALDHPGILRVHSAGEDKGNLYLAYELVLEARALTEACAALPLAARVHLVRDAARALGHAHAQGIVHRDVKPANLLVDSRGQVKVADFGLATAQDLERLTRTGAFVGTPSYMAPEQFAGKGEFSPATDVWALGVVLYEVLTGDVPFPAEDMFALARQVSDGQVLHPREHVSDLPEGLCNACLHALQVDPAERYPDAGAFADALERALAGDTLTASSVAQLRRWMRRRKGALLSLLVLCAAGVTLALAALSPAGLRSPAPAVAGGTPRTPSGLTPPDDHDEPPAALAGEADTLRRTASLDHPCEDAAFLDEERVVTVGSGALVCWRISADPPLREWTLPLEDARRVVVARERSLILVGCGALLRLIDAESREERFPSVAARQDGPTEAVALSADGRFAAFGVQRTVPVVDLDSGKRVAQGTCPALVQSLSFSADGSAVLCGWGNARGETKNSFALFRRDGTWSDPAKSDLSEPLELVRDPDPDRGWWVCYGSGAITRVSPWLEQVQVISAGESVESEQARLQIFLKGLAHPGPVRGLVCLRGGRLLSISGDHGDGDELRLWSPAGELLQVVRHPLSADGLLCRIAAAPSGRTVVTVLQGQRAEVWSVPDPPAADAPAPLLMLEHPGCRAALFLDEHTVLTGGASGVVSWRIKAGEARRANGVQTDGAVTCMVIDPARGVLLVGTHDGFLDVLDAKTLAPIGRTTNFQRALFTPVGAMALVPDGSGHLVIGHGDRVTRFDPRTLDRLWRYQSDDQVTALAASADRILIAWGGNEGLTSNGLTLLDANKTVLQSMFLPGKSEAVFHEEAERWWVSDSSGRVSSVKVLTNQVIRGLQPAGDEFAHRGPARGLAALPDGRMVSVGGNGPSESVLRLWRADGSLEADWPRADPAGSYGQVAVSPNGGVLAVQCRGGAEVWAVPE